MIGFLKWIGVAMVIVGAGFFVYGLTNAPVADTAKISINYNCGKNAERTLMTDPNCDANTDAAAAPKNYGNANVFRGVGIATIGILLLGVISASKKMYR